MAPDDVKLEPTTCPKLLMPLAVLKAPPKIPRAVIAPFCQRKAWAAPDEDVLLLTPATWPRSLMPTAQPSHPPRGARTAALGSCCRSAARGRRREVIVS